MVLLCGLTVCGLSACREQEPEAAFNQPMLDSYDQALPPVAPAKCNAELVGGTAEWVEFREPNLEEMADTGPNGAVKAAVRSLVTEYNDLVAAGEYDGLSEYYIPRQQEAAERVIQAKASILNTLDELAELLKEQAPEHSDAVDQLIEPLLERYSLALNLDWIEVVDEKKATATRMTPGPTATAPDVEVTLKFMLVDDEWFIESPSLMFAGVTADVMQAFLAGYSSKLFMLQQGMMPAQEVLRQLALAGAMAGYPIPEGIDMTPPPPAAMPAGMVLPEGMELPEGMGLPEGMIPPGMVPPEEDTPPPPPPPPPG